MKKNDFLILNNYFNIVLDFLADNSSKKGVN